MENVSINVNAPAESISVEPTRRYLNTRSRKETYDTLLLNNHDV
jgi:hypothetical protein